MIETVLIGTNQHLTISLDSSFLANLQQRLLTFVVQRLIINEGFK